MDTTIEAHGLVKRFGDTTALGGVDLAARTGTVVAVLGPGPARVAAQLLPAGQGQGLEADGVDRLGGHGQPVAGGGDSTTPGSRRRRRETSAWRALAASAGGRSSETASTSWPEVTTRPGSSARRSNSPVAGAGPHLQRAQDADTRLAGHATILPRGRAMADRGPAAGGGRPVQVGQAADLGAVVGVVVGHHPQDRAGRPPLGVVGHPGAGRITVHTPAAGDGLPEVLVVGEPLQPSPEAVVHLVHLGQRQPGTRHRHHPAPDEGTHEVTAGRSR
jgi:hypothetical protein